MERAVVSRSASWRYRSICSTMLPLAGLVVRLRALRGLLGLVLALRLGDLVDQLGVSCWVSHDWDPSLLHLMGVCLGGRQFALG